MCKGMYLAWYHHGLHTVSLTHARIIDNRTNVP